MTTRRPLHTRRPAAARRAARRPTRRTTRRAFTLIEVALTLLVSTLILATVLSIFAMMARANASLGARFEDLNELSRAHSAIRRAMQSLVSGPPVSDLLDQAVADLPGATTPDEEDDDETQRNEDGSLNARTLAERLGIEEQDIPDLHFILQPSTRAARFGVVADDKAPRRLEVVLERQPTPLAPGNDGRPVRGAFEPVYLSGAGDYTRWALDYEPIDPPGDPIRLIDDAALIDWSVLGRAADSDRGERWFGLYEAQEAREYPMAIRLVVMTWDNTRVDWLFEPGVTVGVAEQ